MPPLRFYLHTFGCRVNQADGDALADRLTAAGHHAVEDPSLAELIIVNSCTVTGQSDHDVRKRVRHLHRENPTARIVFTGCYAERDPGALGPADGVWRVLGNAGWGDLARILAEDGDATCPSCPAAGQRTLDPVPVAWRGHTRPHVKVQDGCDAACAYCIVPRVRGAGRSAPPEAVVETVRRLVASGVREITMTGIHLGSYGAGLEPQIPLWRLIRRILDETALYRLRLSSIEPLEFDAGLLALAAGEPRLAPHFHVPLQSGCAATLARMGRPYTPEAYANLIRRLAADRPLAALGADVIVGFPGESETDFQECLDFIESLPLTYLHVFPFSARPGTRAAGMSGAVPPGEIQRRGRRLREVGRRKHRIFVERCLDLELPGLTLRAGGVPPGTEVMTENYLTVRLPGMVLAPNMPVRVRVTGLPASGAGGACQGCLTATC